MMMMIIYTRARAPPHRRAVHGLGPCGHDSQSTSHGTSTAYTVPAPQISNQSEGIGAQFSSMHKQHARQAQHAGRHMAHAARMAGTVHTHTRSATPGRAPEHDSASLLGCRMQPQDTCTPGPQLPHTPRIAASITHAAVSTTTCTVGQQGYMAVHFLEPPSAMAITGHPQLTLGARTHDTTA
jgi:hypothetical protein